MTMKMQGQGRIQYELMFPLYPTILLRGSRTGGLKNYRVLQEIIFQTQTLFHCHF